MRKDSRLSRILHAIIHIHFLEKAVTSEKLGKMLQTNPVVVRRTMALLKEAGYVTSVKGHNGGWSLIKPLSDITLFDIYKVVGEGSLFTIGLTDEHTNCPIEKAVNSSLDGVMSEAETLMLTRFKEITIESLAKNFEGESKV
ncbi:Rrf2 family transcriptional regulator [Pseudoalteromonas sp. S1612]|uniref:RrF2 family transcriptional regulator n=1 Tax=Pseudoalteromonas sp. S1612 TaxID=579507 RepID=UPI00110BDAA5|nr:Rrf2 family transcriptional regulator [Pseudoalteromonas sp. S1612]TMP55917.1 transcriptional regulator [Pseudoalteromonas sp. S1612]